MGLPVENVSLGVIPFEFLQHAPKTGVFGLPFGENHVIIGPVLLNLSDNVMDRQTDGHIGKTKRHLLFVALNRAHTW